MGFATNNNEVISKEKLLIIMSTLRLPPGCILVNISGELSICVKIFMFDACKYQ